MPSVPSHFRFLAALGVLIALAACATAAPPPAAGANQDVACYPTVYRKLRREIRFDVVVEVGPNGKGTIAELPEGLSEEWRAAAYCVVPKLSFRPATRNGEPVASRLTVPITFALD